MYFVAQYEPGRIRAHVLAAPSFIIAPMMMAKK
jgi:hypothetical protein